MTFPFALSRPVAPQTSASAQDGSPLSALAGVRTPPARAAMAKLGLSTAGFQLQEPAAPARKAAQEAEVSTALASAMEAGVRLIDTSPAHGSAESLVGALISLRSPVSLATRTASLAIGVDRVEHRALSSLERFGAPSAGALLVDASDLLDDEGPDLWDTLRRLKDEAYFDAIGIEVAPSDDVLGLARRFKPDVIQAPASLLDQRLIASGALAAVAALGVEVRLKSVFLQGLLFTAREGLPARFADAGPRLSRIRLMLAEAGVDPMQAALAFALGRPEASYGVVEVGSSAELKAVIAAAAAPAPQLDWSAFALDI